MSSVSLRASMIAIVAGCIIGSIIFAGDSAGAISPQIGPEPKKMASHQDDGYDELPDELKAYSMSTLIAMGLVRPPELPPLRLASVDVPSEQPESIRGQIVWDVQRNISMFALGNTGSNEPAAAQHPTIREYALVGGNSVRSDFMNSTRIEATTQFGNSWNRQDAPNCGGRESNDGVPVWVDYRNLFGSALYANLCIDPVPGGPNNSYLALSQTDDAGFTWSNITTSGLRDYDYRQDRLYLWTDQISSGQYRGRTYVTYTRLQNSYPPGTPTALPYNAVGVKYTTDYGVSWSNFYALNEPDERSRGLGTNQNASLAIQPSGVIVAVWSRSIEQEGTASQELIRWSRSTDGGNNFYGPGTIAAIPRSRAVRFASDSPGNFRWSSIPNVAADPIVDGVLYAVWAAYRSDYQSTSAAIYLSKGTTNNQTGNISWSQPTLVWLGALTDKYQYFPWVQVSRDRVVHITFGAQPPDAPANNYRIVNTYYVQSTDGGASFTEPYRVNVAPFTTSSFMGDYQAISVGGYRTEPNGGKTETLLATWTETENGTGATENRWGRFGTFCSSLFTDVPPGSTFYSYGRCLSCKGVLTGYECGGVGEACDPDRNAYLRPNAQITRGQIAKIVSNAANFTNNITGQTFQDVQPGSTFYVWIERLAQRGYMTGYACGEPGEPCVNNRPYFRPFTNATRGQLSKIVSNAAGFSDPPGAQIFEDVPSSHVFYAWIQRLASRNIMQGYPCGGPGEPCISGKPYFRPFNNVTRGQSAKIVANAFFPECTPPTFADEKPKYEAPQPVETIPGPVGTTEATWTPTDTPTNTPTNTPTWTPTPCPGCGNFVDVPAYNEFYPYIQCLNCRNAISGYACGGPGEPCDVCNTPYFRPSYYIIRGQLAKMVSNSAGWNEAHTEQTFEDVPTGNDYYVWIQRITSRGVIGGYPCGGSPAEPCIAPDNRPYFRPWTEATRGQVAKAVSNAKGYSEIPPGQTFEDVAVGSTFYYFVERLNSRGIMAGYPCGGPGEPCITGKPYFRPLTSATRAQASKATSRAFFPECNPAAGSPDGSEGRPEVILSATAPPQTTITATPIPTGPVPTTTSAPTSVSSVTIPPPLPTIPLPLPTRYAPTIPPVATVLGTIPLPSVTVPLP